MRPAISFLSLSAVLAAGAPSAAQTTPTANDIPIELPVYTVTDIPFVPLAHRWSHASFENIEVLSGATPEKTQDVIQELLRFRQALNLLLPGIENNRGAPLHIVLCHRNRRFEEFLSDEQKQSGVTRTGLFARTPESSALVVDMNPAAYFLSGSLVELGSTIPERLARMRDLPDVDAEEQLADLRDGRGPDSYRRLYRHYLKYVFSSMERQPEPWAEEGLLQLFLGMRITERAIILGRVDNPNLPGGNVVDVDFNTALARQALMPLSEMFAVPPDSPQATTNAGYLWGKQCYAFVHWGIYGELGKNQKNFLTFLLRLNKEPLTEAMFKECFGKSYDEMLLVLRSHIDWTRSKVAGLQAAKGEKLPLPPVVEVREATEAEIGRIRGDVLLALGQPVPARQAMIAAYMRGDRDPELLAALGVWESRHGDSGKARRFLELAIKNGTRRPHAYLEMVALQRTDISTPRLTVAQAAPLFALAYKALRHPPKLVASYRTIAELWKDCEVAAPNPHLEVMLEGVRMFPRDVELLFQVAVQCRRSGRVDEARALAARGLSLAADEATRTRFQTLADSLPPAPS